MIWVTGIVEATFREGLRGVNELYYHGQSLYGMMRLDEHRPPGIWSAQLKMWLGASEGMLLRPVMSPDDESVLQALFTFRDFVNTNGFRWATSECQRFDDQAAAAGWPASWFLWAETDGEPWLIHLSQELVDASLAAAERLVSLFEQIFGSAPTSQ